MREGGREGGRERERERGNTLYHSIQEAAESVQ